MTTLLWRNLSQDSSSRTRFARHSTWLFGIALTVLSHGALGGLVFYYHVLSPPSPEAARSFIYTNLVSFQQRFEKPWLPLKAPSEKPEQSQIQAKSTLLIHNEDRNPNSPNIVQDGKHGNQGRMAKKVRNTSTQDDVSDEDDVAPTMLSMAIAKSQLLTDPEKDRRYRFAIPPELNRAGVRMFALVKICISRAGDVQSASLVKSMDPAADPLLIAKVKTWKYRPFAINGHRVPFCYNLRYDLEIQ